MTKVHVLADESLGGIKREYVEVDRKTLEPTNIIHADGKRYRMVDRKAEVGEKVIIVNDQRFPEEHNGKVGEVVYDLDISASVNIDDTLDYYPHVYIEEYRVLEPLDKTVDEYESPSIIDLLANLARRVTSLERQLADTQRNLEKFAQQTESNTHDIAFLDERTALTFNESQLTAVLRAVMVAAGGDGE